MAARGMRMRSLAWLLPHGRPVSAYWRAWAGSITFFAGFYALLVPLPRYLARVGLQDWQIGFVLGAFGVAGLLTRPLSGVLVDRVGARTLMFVGAAALGSGALALPTTDRFAILVALRVVQAIGYVAFTTAATSLVVALVKPDERAGRLATFGAAANIAIALAPAIVTALLEVAPLEMGLLASAGCAVAAGLIAASLPHARRVTARAFEIVPPRAAWLAMLVTALLGAGFAAFFQFAPILADRRALPAGLLYTVYGAAIIATRVLAGRVLDRISVARVVVGAASLMALGFITIAATQSLAPLLLAVAAIAISGGLFHPALLAHHAALVPEAPGRASAAFYLAFDLGIGVGSWLLGLALQVGGISALYAAAALFAGAALTLAPRLGLERT